MTKTCEPHASNATGAIVPSECGFTISHCSSSGCVAAAYTRSSCFVGSSVREHATANALNATPSFSLFSPDASPLSVSQAIFVTRILFSFETSRNMRHFFLVSEYVTNPLDPATAMSNPSGEMAILRAGNLVAIYSDGSSSCRQRSGFGGFEEIRASRSRFSFLRLSFSRYSRRFCFLSLF